MQHHTARTRTQCLLEDFPLRNPAVSESGGEEGGRVGACPIAVELFHPLLARAGTLAAWPTTESSRQAGDTHGRKGRERRASRQGVCARACAGERRRPLCLPLAPVNVQLRRVRKETSPTSQIE
eukprot:363267-Chlamydomonas_euryale.AAC.7